MVVVHVTARLDPHPDPWTMIRELFPLSDGALVSFELLLATTGSVRLSVPAAYLRQTGRAVTSDARTVVISRGCNLKRVSTHSAHSARG